MSVQFDPNAFVQRLEGEGVPSTQARAHVDVLRDALLGGLAARDDVRAIAEEIDGLRGQLVDIHRGLTGVNQEVRTELDALRAEFEQRLDVIAGAIAAGASGARARQSGGSAWSFLVFLGALCVLAAGFAAGVMAPDDMLGDLLSRFR